MNYLHQPDNSKMKKKERGHLQGFTTKDCKMILWFNIS